MDRQAALLGGLPRTARVIEIGPSYSPLAPKRDGWNTTVIDHGSRADLVAKYASDPNVDTSQIEEVDYVWQGGSLADLIPSSEHGTFDAFIASHVIEHTTDVVGFLKAAETLIKAGGEIILAVPDKRKCFDFYRYPSTTYDAIAAFEEKRSRHDRRTHFEYGMRMANKGGAAGWLGDDTRDMVLTVPFEHAPGWLKVAESSNYVDAHNWVFIPASFELLMLELAGLGYFDLEVNSIREAPATEFYAWLRKGQNRTSSEAMQMRRRSLMNRVIVELAEQSRQIPGSPLSQLLAPGRVPEVDYADRVATLNGEGQNQTNSTAETNLSYPTELDLIGRKFGTDKSGVEHDYLSFYEERLAYLKNKNFLMIEIGVLRGGSLRTWGEYFPNATIVGLDITPETTQYAGENRHVMIGNAADPAFIEQVIEKFGRPLIVLDDGSHFWDDQICALRGFWPQIQPGGAFIMEDLHTSMSGVIDRDDCYVQGSPISAYDYIMKMNKRVVGGGFVTDAPADDEFILKSSPTIRSIECYSRTCIIRKKATA